MTITNQKELSKLLDLCRKKGVDSIEIDNIKLKLAPSPKKEKATSTDSQAAVHYSPEDILNWSAQEIY